MGGGQDPVRRGGRAGRGGRRLMVVLLPALIALDAAAVGATVSGTAGATVRGRPASVREHAWTSDTRILVLSEAIDRTLERSLPIDVAIDPGPGLTITSLPPQPPDLAVGTTIHSHLVHAQRPRGRRADIVLQGRITFAEPIVALALTQDRLDPGDRDVGAAGMRYPTAGSPATADRGLELGTARDRLAISADRRTLTVRLRFHDSLDQLRVLTAGRPCDVLGTNGNDRESNGNSQLVAQDPGDVVCGLGGNDELFGLGGDEVLRGGSGVDRLVAFDGDDVLDGGPDNDLLFGGRGDDRLLGGPGNDEAYYDGSPDIGLITTPIKGDLLRGRVTAKGGGAHPDLGIDRLSSIETIWGTNGDDLLIGSGREERFFGRGGADTIEAGGGDDDLFGDDPYHFDAAGRPNGGDTLRGQAGDDRLFGGLLGDTLDGGPGFDIASFDATGDPDRRAVSVDLRAGTATGHGSDTLVSIEGAFGGLGEDTLIGNGQDNVLMGGGGPDTLTGGGGDDVLIGGVPAIWYTDPAYSGDFARDPNDDGADVLDGGPGNDLLAAVDADGKADSLAGGADVDVCRTVEPGTDTRTGCEVRPDGPGIAGARARRAAMAPSADARDFYVAPSEIAAWVWAELEFGPLRFERLEFTLTRAQTREIAELNPGTASAKSVCRPYQDLRGRPFMSRSIAALAACRQSIGDAWATYWRKEFTQARDARGCVRVRWTGMAGDLTLSDRRPSDATCRR